MPVLRPATPVHSLHFRIPIICTTYYFWHQSLRRAQKLSVCSVTGHLPWASGHSTHVPHTLQNLSIQHYGFKCLRLSQEAVRRSKATNRHLKCKSRRAVGANCLRRLAAFLRDVAGRQKPQTFRGSNSAEWETNSSVFQFQSFLSWG